MDLAAQALELDDRYAERETAETAPIPETSEHADTTLPFAVLGHNHSVFYYLAHRSRQVVEITAAGHTQLNLLQLADLSWWARQYPARSSRSPVAWDTAADTLIRNSHRKGIFDQARLRGRGAWWDAGRAVEARRKPSIRRRQPHRDSGVPHQIRLRSWSTHRGTDRAPADGAAACRVAWAHQGLRTAAVGAAGQRQAIRRMDRLRNDLRGAEVAASHLGEWQPRHGQVMGDGEHRRPRTGAALPAGRIRHHRGRHSRGSWA